MKSHTKTLKLTAKSFLVTITVVLVMFILGYFAGKGLYHLFN